MLLEIMNFTKIKYVTRLILLAFALLNGACKSAENRDDSKANDSKEQVKADSLEGKDFTGARVRFHGYHPNDTFMVETYQKGVLDGPYRAYNEIGILIVRGSYKNGKLEGTYEDFYSNGKIKLSYLFHDDKLFEIISMRDSSGIELDHGQIKNGNGLVRTYLEMGQLENEGYYLNGYKEGYWKHWNGREYSDSTRYIHGINQKTGLFEAI